MKLKLYTASGAFIADCEVGGTEYPEFVRWGDRVFQNVVEYRAIFSGENKYVEMSIPQVRTVQHA
jgi:hypothetical protein